MLLIAVSTLDIYCQVKIQRVSEAKKSLGPCRQGSQTELKLENWPESYDIATHITVFMVVLLSWNHTVPSKSSWQSCHCALITWPSGKVNCSVWLRNYEVSQRLPWNLFEESCLHKNKSFREPEKNFAWLFVHAKRVRFCSPKAKKL